MKKAGYIILLFFPFQALGQAGGGGLDFGTVSLGAVYSPDYCFRTLKFGANEKWVENLRNEDEVPMFGYTAGIGGRVEWGKNIRLETGLFYSLKGVQTRYSELVWVSPDPDLPVRRKTKYQFKYIDFPLKFTGFLDGGKTKFFVSLGIAGHFFMGRRSRTFVEYADGHSETEKSSPAMGYPRFGLSVLAGLGMEYELSKRLSIVLQPEYRRFVTSILQSDYSSEYLYSIGANLGVYYSLRRKG